MLETPFFATTGRRTENHLCEEEIVIVAYGHNVELLATWTQSLLKS